MTALTPTPDVTKGGADTMSDWSKVEISCFHSSPPCDQCVEMEENPTQDPRDIVNCACPRIDGQSCLEVRSMPTAQLADREECECRCHELYEARLTEMDDESAAVTKGSP